MLTEKRGYTKKKMQKEPHNKILNNLKEIDIAFHKVRHEHVDLSGHKINSAISKLNESLDQILEKILVIFRLTGFESEPLQEYLNESSKMNFLGSKIEGLKMEMRELIIHQNSQLMQKIEEQSVSLKESMDLGQSMDMSISRIGKVEETSPILDSNIMDEIEEIAEEPEEFPLMPNYVLEASSLSPHFTAGKNTIIGYASENEFLVAQADNCYSVFKDRKYLTTFKNSKNKSKIY